MILLLTLVSSVHADAVRSAKSLSHLDMFQTVELASMSRTEFRDFLAAQLDDSEFGGFLAERFEGNNGLHLGFFKAANNGNHLGSTETAGSNSAGGNSGKHIGFSVAAFNPGMRFGLVNPRRASPSVSQNPEPTGMLLLGTGLAAVAGFARRRARRRRHVGN